MASGPPAPAVVGGLAVETRDERDGTSPDHSPQHDPLALVAAAAAVSKKASSTVVLHVGPLFGITDDFVITSAGNTRLVKTIAEEVERKVKEAGGPGPASTEGLDDARWVLLDYGDFVVHVFLEEAREYYDIERLWADAARTDFPD